MQAGAVLSQIDLGPDVRALRDYAQAVQDLGYDFLVAADHVVGADPSAHAELPRVFSIDALLREPLSVFAFVAGVAPRLGFLPSVVILPQRQTIVVAKQAVDVDQFCGSRLRLGVGIGWNPTTWPNTRRPESGFCSDAATIQPAAAATTTSSAG